MSENTGLHILVADDDPDIRTVLRMFLEADGQTVVVAHDGDEAMHIIASQLLDAAVLDVTLRGIDGLSLLARARADRSTRDLPIVVLTAVPDVFDPLLTPYRTRRTQFISKPAFPDDVTRAILEMLTESDAPALKIGR